MPLMWKPRDRETIQRWIDAILDEASDSLTSWEADFVDSIATQVAMGRTLSRAQEETLEKIYAEKTA